MLAIPAVASACVLLLPVRRTGKLARHLDLLLPLGLYITIMELLSTLTMIPVLAAVLAPSWSFTILSLSFSVSAAFLLLIAIAIAYAGWTTMLVLQAVREDRVDPIAALANVGRWFWRISDAEFIGWGVLFAGLAGGLTLGAAALPVVLLCRSACSSWAGIC